MHKNTDFKLYPINAKFNQPKHTAPSYNSPTITAYSAFNP